MAIFFKYIEGTKAGQLESFDKDQIRIGRQSDNDIKFDPQKDISVSGYHAEIYRDGEGFFIKDLQSRNGTFVNSRKIDQPVALKEGDTVQFSARGPKIVFFVKDPTVASDVAVAESPESASTQVFTAAEVKEENAPAEKKSSISEKINRILPVASAIGALLVLAGVGHYLGVSWWVLLVGAATTVLVAGGAYLGWRFWKRRRAARKEVQDARQDREASLGRESEDSYRTLRRKWGEVVRSLRESKLQGLRDDAIYAFPWLVVIGEPGSGKSALIKGSGPLSSVTTPGEEGPTRNCDWWFFDKVLALDTSGRYVFQAKESDTAGEWQELLNLLRSNRRREPVNGVLVALPADVLASRPLDKLKEQAAQLRERLDEMVQRLSVKFPVYVAITKSDLITGFNEFFAGLPDQVKGQALGYVNSEADKADVGRFFEKAFRTICERAERLRLATIFEAERNDAMQSMFLFPAELKSLRAPLRAFVDVLFRPSPYRDAPFFRGLFLTSARQTGLPSSRLARLLGLSYAQAVPARGTRDIFLRDLFAVIFPNDRALVGRTAQGRERYQLKRAAGLVVAVAASLLLCGFFTLSFTNNWLALSRFNPERCAQGESSTGTMSEILRPFDTCRESIERLTPRSLWQKVAFNFGLGYSKKVGKFLQQRYLTDFRAKVLDPIDARIDRSLSSGSADALMVSLIVQRLERLGHCQQDGWCDESEDNNGMSYPTMLAVAQSQVKEGDPAIDRLQRTHESYLAWQSDPQVLREMYAKDLSRIRDWSRRGNLTEEWVLESTKAQFAPIRASDLWEIPSSLQVDGAYTARAWREGISPLVSGLEKMATDQDFGVALKQFHENYHSRALSQWENFFAKFPDVENALRATADKREFGAKVLGPDSPYDRAIEMGSANLSVVLGQGWQANDLAPWAAMLKRYMALKAKIQEGQGGGKQPVQGKDQGQDGQAIKYLKMYLDAVAEFRSDLGAPDKAFASAQKAFQDGIVSSGATHPALKATWALGALKDEVGSRQGEDAIFWTLLDKPLALAWRAMLAETGGQLQEQWNKLRLGIKNQPEAASERIYGFATDGPAAPFLQRGPRWEPRRLLNQNVRFTDQFLRYLSRLRSEAIAHPTGPQAASGPEPPPYIVNTN